MHFWNHTKVTRNKNLRETWAFFTTNQHQMSTCCAMSLSAEHPCPLPTISFCIRQLMVWRHHIPIEMVLKRCAWHTMNSCNNSTSRSNTCCWPFGFQELETQPMFLHFGTVAFFSFQLLQHPCGYKNVDITEHQGNAAKHITTAQTHLQDQNYRHHQPQQNLRNLTGTQFNLSSFAVLN